MIHIIVYVLIGITERGNGLTLSDMPIETMKPRLAADRTDGVSNSMNESNSDIENYLEVITQVIPKEEFRYLTLKDDNHVVPLKRHDEMALLLGEITEMAWQSVEQDMTGCHYVLVTFNTQNSLAKEIIRYASLTLQPLMVVNILDLKKTARRTLMSRFWGGPVTVCRAMIIDGLAGDLAALLTALDDSDLWLWPRTRVVIVGSKWKARAFLLDLAFRNNLQPIYLGLENSTARLLDSSDDFINMNRYLSQTRTSNIASDEIGNSSSRVYVYGRCLYCDKGQPNVRFLSFCSLGAKTFKQTINPFPNQERNLHGHLLRAVSMSLFPYADYSVDSDEPASTVTMRDSLDKRMLDIFSSQLNFTYEVRAPWDMQWGVPTASGNWTGLLGTIQYDKADFTTVMSTNPTRNTIVDHARVYVADVMAVVSLKPQVLPRYLVIIRPFTADVWVYLVASIMIWGTTFWLLQRTWSHFSGNKGFSFSSAIFYSWAIVLEDPPPKTPTNTSGQMLMGWWLIACLVMTTAFKSSLVAHLTVQSKTPPIDTFDDMVHQVNWKWGIERKMLTGGPLSYFKASTDPVVMTVYKHVEGLPQSDGLAKVLEGGYSFLMMKNFISTSIASYHTDGFGRTPYYISKYGHKMLSDFGWGFRKGAPFRSHMTDMMNWLIEAGILDQWTEEIMKSRVIQNRKEAEQKQISKGKEIDIPQILATDDSVLRLSHVMGVFIMLLFGIGTASIIFLVEKMVHKIQASRRDASDKIDQRVSTGNDGQDNE